MLIQALCDYYDILARQGKVLPDGYSQVGISYLISLTKDGVMDGIIDVRDKTAVENKGKIKEVYSAHNMLFPKTTEKSGIESNIAETRPLYIFGLNYAAPDKKDPNSKEGFSPQDDTSKAIKSHEAFIETNTKFFSDIEDNLAKAFVAFLNEWVPEDEVNNPFLLSIGKDYKNARFAFCLSGHPEIMLHEIPKVKEKWEEIYISQNNDKGGCSQCAITGEMLPVARLHNKIKGINGGQSSGTVLVSFNNESEYSYGKEQSFNSNISEKAMSKYTEALNHLLSDRSHKTIVDETTVIHWAASDSAKCDDLFNDLFGFSDKANADEVDVMLSKLMQEAAQGMARKKLEDMDIDPSVQYYIVGIKPNAARLSVKFVYRQEFGKLITNILQHQMDMQMTDELKNIPLWRIKKEMLIPNSTSDNIDPSVTARIMDSILNGYRYPEIMFNTIVRRIRSDRDDTDANNKNIRMNAVRMGILKACINRSDRLNGKEEEIKMALDGNNTNPAYLCGRLFAVLEDIQQKASNYSLNRTIKDSYFSSASAKPATIFPRLITLSQHHLKNYESSRFDEQNMREIIDMFGSKFPDTLSLKEQGIFMLGYYQQYADKYKKINEYKNKKEDN